MRTVRLVIASALVAEVALLAGIAAATGLGAVGWLAGLTCGIATNLLLARGLRRSGASSVNPAHAVTLGRATLVGAVAALVADGWTRPVHVGLAVVLATVALCLDAVDGLVARRTGSSTALGARFDMEVDAFLILVLSVQTARTLGLWVLAIGAARYLFGITGWVWRWLRATPPPRYWRKTVAAIQGVVLTVAIADVLPRTIAVGAVAVALALLAESFGRDVRWLRQLHRGRVPSAAPSLRGVLGLGMTTGALALLWAALVLPNDIAHLTPGAFVRVPIEGVVLVAFALVLPGRYRTVFAGLTGAVLGVLAVLKILDIGFSDILDRPFNPLTDQDSFGPAIGVVRDSVGSFWAHAAEIGVVLLVVLILVGVTLAAMRLSRVGARHRPRSVRILAVLGVVWVVLAGAGFSVAGGPIASTSTSAFAVDEARQIDTTLHDKATFAHALVAADPMAAVPPKDLLTALRGKDVIVAVVESYGRVAVQDSSISAGVDAAVQTDGAALSAAGFQSRSAFLTSPTFGGISWLAHSTLQSGLWIDTKQRYGQLVTSNRFTLSDAFKKAGWRTVVDVPSNTQDWPQGRTFYHYDKIYDSRNVGYAGPKFSYARMPDEYVLSAFARNELEQPGHQPVMAEIDLVSSHAPWAPLPKMVDWNAVGNGSVFDPMPAQGQQPDVVWRNAGDVQAAYGQSIEYTLAALTSFVQNVHDNNLVLVVYGDHQPATIVSGTDAGHDVPISIIAHDPQVLDRVSSWGWQDGLLPGPQAPVLRMDGFRDRFLTAFGK